MKILTLTYGDLRIFSVYAVKEIEKSIVFSG